MSGLQLHLNALNAKAIQSIFTSPLPIPGALAESVIYDEDDEDDASLDDDESDNEILYDDASLEDDASLDDDASLEHDDASLDDEHF